MRMMKVRLRGCTVKPRAYKTVRGSMINTFKDVYSGEFIIVRVVVLMYRQHACNENGYDPETTNPLAFDLQIGRDVVFARARASFR